MPKSLSKVYIHFVWATWDRMPLIEEHLEAALHSEMCHQAQRLGCDVIAVGGTHNHVHLLLRLPATVCVSQVAKEVKGATSFFVNEKLSPVQHFRWQGSYSAHSVSRWNISAVAEYISRQKEHHTQGTVRAQLELEENESQK